MQSVAIPVVALSNIAVVEVEMDVIVSTKVVGRVKKRPCAHK